MNRRTFFSSLFVGLSAAPMVAKAICEPPEFGKQHWINNTQKYFGEVEWVNHPAWDNAQYDASNYGIRILRPLRAHHLTP